MKKTKTIVLAGGHAATTALATIQELKRNRSFKEFNLHWIGPKSAIEGNAVPTIEEKVFPDFGVAMHAIVAGRLQRKFSAHTLPSLFKIPTGFWQSYRLLRSISPSIVVSFGGNVGLSVSVAAWLLGIPLIVHEQTVAAGLANRLSAKLATKVALARIESQQFFPVSKSIIVGNPIVREIAKLPAKLKKSKRPNLFVMGGSRGSQIINKVVKEALPELIKNYSIIHQTGEIDFVTAVPEKHYEVYSTISPIEIAKTYGRADIIIGRSGANTVTEVICLRRPAIFVPIPWVQHNEQKKNALIAKKSGLASIIEQDNFTPKNLIDEVNRISRNWEAIVSRAEMVESLPDDREAAGKLVALMQTVIEK